MIYTKTYRVNRLMHLRPCSEASRAVDNLQRDLEGLQIILENTHKGLCVIGSGAVRYILELKPAIGDQVRISLSGNFQEDQVREGTEKIGRAFSSFEEIPPVKEYFD